MDRLKGKRALITGGAGEIGRTTARLFLNEGARVMLVDKNEDGLEAARTALGPSVITHIADVSDAEQVNEYVEAAVDKMGGIDVFFNNAGIEGVVAPITDYPEDVFDRVLSVNVKGVWLGMKYVMPAMTKGGGGSIIASSSVAGLKPVAGITGYSVSKHAVVGIMRMAAAEGVSMGIRVNSIHPAPVDNQMMRSLENKFAPGAGDAVKSQLEAGIPMKRYATNKEVANLVLSLASDESSYVTGTCNVLDGGMML